MYNVTMHSSTLDIKKTYHTLNRHDLKITFLEACDNGNYDAMRYMLTSPDIHAPLDRIAITYGMLHACSYGYLPIVDYLLTSEEITVHADTTLHNMDALSEACKGGHLDIVRYLLTSPMVKQRIDIHENDDMALQNACFSHHYDIVNYLLSSDELLMHANIHAEDDVIFKRACHDENVELLQLMADHGCFENVKNCLLKQYACEFLKNKNIEIATLLFKNYDFEFEYWMLETALSENAGALLKVFLHSLQRKNHNLFECVLHDLHDHCIMNNLEIYQEIINEFSLFQSNCEEMSTLIF